MIPPTDCLPRRRKCASATREAILGAARERFLAESYDAVGMRDIARDAGVDVALVSRYFGSKEDLFRQVLRGGEEAKTFAVPEGVDLPAFMTSLLAEDQAGGDPQHHRDKLVIMLRSAASATASHVIQDAFEKDVLAPLAAAIGGPNAERKAVLTMAILIGTNFLRTVLPVPASCRDEQCAMDEEFRRVLTAVLDRQPDLGA